MVPSKERKELCSAGRRKSHQGKEKGGKEKCGQEKGCMEKERKSEVPSMAERPKGKKL